MKIPAGVARLHPEMTAWRRDLHAHPETAFQERRTARLVARQLESWGLDVHEGLASTGVVGVLRAGRSDRSLGLRADMDALDLEEATGLPYASRTRGKMHACGHDGHTAMLLGAARHLAETRRFDGTLHFIFQPAEENEGGAARMIEEGLFERFQIDEVYALHNHPGLAVGRFAVRPGPVMAALDVFDVEVRGEACHAARPEQGSDSVACAAQLVTALQAIPARDLSPLDPAVVSVTQIHGGSTWNVIPERVTLRGTARAFDPRAQDAVEARMGELVRHLAAAHGCQGRLTYRRRYPPTVNSRGEAAVAASAATRVAGEGAVDLAPDRLMAAEDFAFMLREKPGCYVLLGNGEDSVSVHNPRYDFNDDALPVGAAFWVALVEGQLATPAEAGRPG